MKWFKHESDAHMNLKLQAVIDRFGLVAFGYYWVLVELVANQGTDYCLKKDKEWSTHLKKFINIDVPTQKKYLLYFGEKGLIDKDSLMKGDLYIPKLEERSDEYTQKLKRKSGQGPDNVGLEEKRRDKKRTEEKKPTASISYLKNIPEEDLEAIYQNFDCSKQGIKNKAEDLWLWCKSNGKEKKNYKAFLLVAIRKDFPVRRTPVRTYTPAPREPEKPTEPVKPLTPEEKKKHEELMAGIREVVKGKTIKSE